MKKETREGKYISCKKCGKYKYSYPSENRQFCSKSCAISFRNLTELNPSYRRDISGMKNPMYGRRRCGSENPMFGRRKHLCPQWKGGRKIRKDGYVLSIASDNHPYPADRKNGMKYVLEHRLVMESKLGRFLEPNEIVHHIDGNPSNNHSDNLQLFQSQSEHIRLGHG